MQSWGLRGKWVIRDSGDEPTKSGIVGLIGCALGYRRGDKRLVNEIDSRIRIGVRVEAPGSRVKDFHTVRGVFLRADGLKKGSDEDPYTEISSRTYLQDASFLVVIEGPENLLHQIYDAMINPEWPVFLGRKSCPPTRPVTEEITQQYKSLADALKRYPWSASSVEIRGAAAPEQLRCVVEDAGGNAILSDRMLISPARMYGNRKVKEFYVDTPLKEELCTSQD